MPLTGHVDDISRSVIEGWAIDTDSPDEAISISILVNGAHRGMCLTTHARTDLVLPNGAALTGKCGFYFTFDPPLSPFVELRIDVVETWSAQPLPNGSRTLPRPLPRGDDGAGIRPILLTSTGRTGTTLLMSEFARHSAVVVGDQYPYEIKQIAYHAAAFRALAADADWERSTTPDTMLAPEMNRIIGSNPYNMAGLYGLGGESGGLRDFYQSTMPSGYATLFRRFIMEFYTTLANAQGKSSAPYFCEKGDIDEAAVHGARLFFGAVKDIVIVRDPRDLLCSAIAFWKLKPEAAMNMLTTTIPRLARIARLAGPDTIVIRYEDLVREPGATRRSLSRFLDLDLVSWPADTVEQVPDTHRTSRDPTASIGRWRNDLTPDQTEACEWAFGAYMRDFDYEPSVAAGRPVARNQILVAEGTLAVADFIENSVAESEAGFPSRQVLELLFGRGGTGETSTGEGWSPPERGFVWSNANESHLRLPPIRRDGKYWLHITASPFTHGTDLPTQRVTVMLGARAVGSARARDICVLAIPLPPAVSRSGQAVTLTLRFPDARRPSDLFAGADNRLLGFSLHRIALFRVDATSPLPAPVRKSARYVRANGLAEPNDDLHGAEPTMIAGVTRLLRDVFEQPELEYHPRAMLSAQRGYDVTRFVRLVLALEAEFGIVLHEDDVDSIATMGDIVGVLGCKVLDNDPLAKAARTALPPKTRSNLGGKINPPRANLASATRRI
jgi:acyl carrier protein